MSEAARQSLRVVRRVQDDWAHLNALYDAAQLRVSVRHDAALCGMRYEFDWRADDAGERYRLHHLVPDRDLLLCYLDVSDLIEPAFWKALCAHPPPGVCPLPQLWHGCLRRWLP